MFVTGKQLQERGVTTTQLLQYLKDGLQAHDPLGKPIDKKSVDHVVGTLFFHYEWNAYGLKTDWLQKRRLIELVSEWLFSAEDVERFCGGLQHKTQKVDFYRDCLKKYGIEMSNADVQPSTATEVDQAFPREPSGTDANRGKDKKSKRPNVKAKWDSLAEVKRNNHDKTARQFRALKEVLALCGGNPPTEDTIRKKLKRDYGLSFSKHP